VYTLVFSRRARRAFLDLPNREALRVKERLERLQENPRMRGTIKLEDVQVASYRHRVGNYRILFDIDDENRVIEILDIRRRSESTYR
jgi:mRNA interferase RelE/StbE